MPTAEAARDYVVKTALSFDGVDDGHGYDCANPFSADLGHPQEAWCADFYTDVCRRAGVTLPVMQDGCHTGFAGVEAGVTYAQHHDAFNHSWLGKPGDGCCFHWPGGVAGGDHIEMVVRWEAGYLYTIGGNSGPSNVNGHGGIGGVHQHKWICPEGQGNSQIMGVIDLAKIVDLTKTHPVIGPKPAPVKHPRTLMLKSPHMHGGDVKDLQEALNKALHPHGQSGIATDGVFGTATAKAVKMVQLEHYDPLGVVGVHTRKLLELT